MLACWSDCRFYPAKVTSVNKDGKEPLLVLSCLLVMHFWLYSNLLWRWRDSTADRKLLWKALFSIVVFSLPSRFFNLTSHSFYDTKELSAGSVIAWSIYFGKADSSGVYCQEIHVIAVKLVSELQNPFPDGKNQHSHASPHPSFLVSVRNHEGLVLVLCFL